MRKDLLRRLATLEARSPQSEICGVCWYTTIPAERRSKLGENEKIVEDWYLESDDRLDSTRERVTADPSDVGLNYKRDGEGYTVDVSDIQRNSIPRGRSRICGVTRNS